VADLQTAPSYPTPARFEQTLANQRDMALVANSGGISIWSNSAFYGLVASLSQPLANDRHLTPGEQVSATPLNLTWGVHSPISGNRFLVPLAPSSAWSLEIDGHAVARHTVLGWIGEFDGGTTGMSTGTLVLHQVPLNALFALLTLGLWGVVAISFGHVERMETMFRTRRLVRSR
jgi:hypothetical protein